MLTLMAAPFMAVQPLFAQEKKEKKEIIIRKSEDGDGKMVIVVDGDKVTINGKEITGDEKKDMVIMKKALPEGGKQDFDFDFDFEKLFKEGGKNGKGWQQGEIRAQLGVQAGPNEKGAEVISVTEGSAAEKAGLKEKDIIVAVNGDKIEGPQELVEAIQSKKPGEEIEVSIIRGEKTEKVKATLGSAKVMSQSRSFSFPIEPGSNPFLEEMIERSKGESPLFGEGEARAKPRLGVQLEETASSKGLKVLEVVPDSPADKAGLKKDDVIRQWGGKELKTIEDVRAAMPEPGEEAALEIERNGKRQTITVQLPKPLKRGRF
jgi:serine protease Do